MAFSPPVAEQSGVTHHGKTLVRDVTDESADEGVRAQGGKRRMSTHGVVFEGEPHQPPVVEGNSVLGQYGALGVTPDVAHAESRIEQRGAYVRVPRQAP
jgi:hypothetical protein